MNSSSSLRPRQFLIGEFRITQLSDGAIPGGESILRNIDPQKVEDTLRQADCFPTPVQVNSFLIEHRGRRLLLDTGCGSYMGRRAGGLSAQLESMDIAADDIDAVLLTHIHPDHVGGLTDRESGRRLFQNAALHVHQYELDYWFDDAERSRARELDRALFFDCPREQMSPYRDQLRTFVSGEVFPGITAVPSPGHTPGHSVFVIGSGADQLLIWSDTVHVPEVQIAYPEAGVTFDVDPQAAAESRRKIFDMAVSEEFPVLGMHLKTTEPRRLSRHKDGYRLEPHSVNDLAGSIGKLGTQTT